VNNVACGGDANTSVGDARMDGYVLAQPFWRRLLAPAIWYRAILAMNYFDTDVFGRRVVLAPVKSLTNVCNENG